MGAALFANARKRALELQEVYPPSDNTFLVIEQGEKQISQLLASAYCQLQPEGSGCAGEGGYSANSCATTREFNVLEVGSGSGMISAALLRHATTSCAQNTAALKECSP